MGNLIRVDAELVRRHLARSRAEAADLIRAGAVFLDGVVVTKPARQMDRAGALVVKKETNDDYASRGAYKLLGALDYLGADGPKVKGVRALDAGASTGGFTDVLLRRGAAHVVAVDVGYGQILWRLREDSRVTVLERTNVRTLDPALVAPAPSLVVGDLSFISLTLVLPALVGASAADAEFLLMVKPQFEVGKDELGTGGVVRDPRLHFAAIAKVALAATENGLTICAVAPSPLPGPAGNVEYFLYLRKTKSSLLNLSEQCPCAAKGEAVTKTSAVNSDAAADKGELSSNLPGAIGATKPTTWHPVKESGLPAPADALTFLGEKVTAQIAAAIFAGPAASQEKSLAGLGVPENLSRLVDAELAQHTAYLAQATQKRNHTSDKLAEKEMRDAHNRINESCMA